MIQAISIDLSSVPRRITGAGRYGVEFAKAAQRRAEEFGIDLTAIVAKGEARRIGELTGTRTRELVPSNRVSRLLYEKAVLGRVLSRSRFKLHHGIHYTMPRGFSGKIVVTVHDTTLIDHPEWHERSKVAFFSREIAHAAKFADGIIFPSHFVAERFRALFGQSQPHQVIPHGVRTVTPPDGFDIASVVGKEAAEAGYLLFCGTIEPRKNLERIVEAYVKARSQRYLVLVGLKGWNMDNFANLISSAVNSERIKVLGFVDDATLASLYQHAFCTLYPSLEEGFGLPGLEALAYGSPLITSKDSAMAEYAFDGVKLVDPNSVDEIADAIAGVSDEKMERLRLSKLGRERSLAYNWENSGLAHLDFYRRILES
ncbi:MAG: glycosyltransferase family 1 protein [Actinomycetota bacterium]|nr:glycosyltransferase family 1 protein [Actinomycetota bacterium]